MFIPGKAQRYSNMYEINTRVWIKQFEKGTTLSKIPSQVFDELKSKGIELIWLLGIWKTCPELITKCCFSTDLTSSYSKSLQNWTKEDVIGSPFALDEYEVNPGLGSLSDLKILHDTLNSKGLKLVLDFVPNHFSAASRLIKSHPEIFISVEENSFINDPYTFFKAENSSQNFFAHGRDPFFPVWTDTVQINYFSSQARDFMINKLLSLTELCDGVRCDMAMLQLNNVFQNTWLGILNKKNVKKPDDEFWKIAIEKVKNKKNDFLFIAEAYWDLERQLQQLGFDFTYDKKLTDILSADDIAGVKGHLTAGKEYQSKSVRFLENHDETRAVTKFGKTKSFAAAVLICTIQGLKLFYDGQFEGKKIRLPLQLGREPEEKISSQSMEFYSKLLSITKSRIFKIGEWAVIDPLPVSTDNASNEYMFAWQWKLENEYRLVIINYSEKTSYCRIKLRLCTNKENLRLNDLLNNTGYVRQVKEINTTGLFIKLDGYQSHIFSFFE